MFRVGIIGERLWGFGEFGVEGRPDLVGGDRGQLQRRKLLGSESGVVRDGRQAAGEVELAIICAPQNDFGVGKDEIVDRAGKGVADLDDLHFRTRHPGKGRGFEALGGDAETKMVLEVSEAAAEARASPCRAAGRTPLHGHSPQRRRLQPQPYFSAAASSVQLLHRPLTVGHPMPRLRPPGLARDGYSCR